MANSLPRKKSRTASSRRYKNYNDKQITKLDYSKLVAEAMKLYDPSKTVSRTSTVFSKDTLRTYMQNPATNYKNIRNLSKFLYYRSQSYRRIINYNANMIDLGMRSVVPIVDITKSINKKAMLKSYYQTLMILEKMNLKTEFLKAYITCFREDVFFGCAYLDETDGTFFILPLDPDYCKVTGTYGDGSLAFDMDMSYFSKHTEQLEFWGEPFKSMWSAYQNDSIEGKWQPMPDENCVCLKVNLDDMEIPLPVYLGLFDSLINLEDLKEITAIADEQQIYKMLVAKVPLINGSKEINDFAIDLDLVIKFFDLIKGMMPDYANVALSLTDLEAVDFNHDQASDVNKVEKATQSVMASAGGQALVGGTGTTSTTLAMKLDENFALSSLLPQTEAIVNRLISTRIDNSSVIKFLQVTTFTKQEYISNLIKVSQYGVPIKLELATVLGFSEIETISKAHLEEALGIVDLFKPLKSANTISLTDDSTSKPTEELTDEGEASKEKTDNKT